MTNIIATLFILNVWNFISKKMEGYSIIVLGESTS